MRQSKKHLYNIVTVSFFYKRFSGFSNVSMVKFVYDSVEICVKIYVFDRFILVISESYKLCSKNKIEEQGNLPQNRCRVIVFVDPSIQKFRSRLQKKISDFTQTSRICKL